VLRKNGCNVWNISGGAPFSALTPLGGSIGNLKLEDDPGYVEDLGDGITAPEVIWDVHLIPGFWKIASSSLWLNAADASATLYRRRPCKPGQGLGRAQPHRSKTSLGRGRPRPRATPERGGHWPRLEARIARGVRFTAAISFTAPPYPIVGLRDGSPRA
jgi:hypothetical protein